MRRPYRFGLLRGRRRGVDLVRERQVNGTTVVDDPADAFSSGSTTWPIPGTFELTGCFGRGHSARESLLLERLVGAAYVFADGKDGEDDTGVGTRTWCSTSQASQTNAQIMAAGHRRDGCGHPRDADEQSRR